jgi:hypothetical protein
MTARAFYMRYGPRSTFAETVAGRKPAAIVSPFPVRRPIVRIRIAYSASGGVSGRYPSGVWILNQLHGAESAVTGR